ncbi:hypothetical protein BDY19DRAFT_471275 [Irpex rosettiformis]|uniref:Uncharacterized protein n=1 Tax=Irpex rosettiformis TaxID=378272 RepID=A0ACB8TSH3_9APHY|nr:hypothetical protein BDY19DRAFT_471275 [Irpex rosettiformis]
MNGTRHGQQPSSTSIPDSLTFSDSGGEDAVEGRYEGEYSTRLEELLSDDEGVDSHPSGTYREQLRDVLGPEHEDDEVEEVEVENSLVQSVRENEIYESAMDDEARPVDLSSDQSAEASSPSTTDYLSPPKVVISGPPVVELKAMRQFLHPTVSRLRSTTPQASRASSVGSVGTLNSHLGLSTPASHFSALSPESSQSDLPKAHAQRTDQATTEEREVFRWSQLRSVSELVYGHHAQKVASILGTPHTGSPTVLAANGSICIGTDTGNVLVFDFKQNLKCVCSPPGM